MRRSLLPAVLSLSLLLSAVATTYAASYTFTTIDVPGFRWTVAEGLNGAGDIVGSYLDVEGGQHGFLDTGTSMVISMCLGLGTRFPMASTLRG
jgi:hypothetical protein